LSVVVNFYSQACSWNKECELSHFESKSVSIDLIVGLTVKHNFVVKVDEIVLYKNNVFAPRAQKGLI
jgi:hypothetical protein